MDSAGDPIEIHAVINDEEIILDDLGHIAGLLFQVGQHGRDTMGHQLVKNIARTYDAFMDYDSGTLRKSIAIHESYKILDFFQVLTAIKTATPEIRYRKRMRRAGSRLVSLMSREIKQLKLPLYVQRQVEIEGKNEVWTVDFKYSIRMNGKSSDVIIVTADLKWGEPREKAAHALTLAVDVLSSQKGRDLRIVYDAGRNGNGKIAQRAVGLLEDNQSEIGYRAYNYGDENVKSLLATQINQELSPYLFKQG